MKGKRWQDWLNLLLGAWLFISPWTLGFKGELPGAAMNAHVVGAAVLIIAALAVYLPHAWEEILNFLLGAWAVAAPWVLGFASNREAMANTVVVGVLVAVLALWAATKDGSLQAWRHTKQTT